MREEEGNKEKKVIEFRRKTKGKKENNIGIERDMAEER